MAWRPQDFRFIQKEIQQREEESKRPIESAGVGLHPIVDRLVASRMAKNLTQVKERTHAGDR